jgi:hypothetical protein
MYGAHLCKDEILRRSIMTNIVWALCRMTQTDRLPDYILRRSSFMQTFPTSSYLCPALTLSGMSDSKWISLPLHGLTVVLTTLHFEHSLALKEPQLMDSLSSRDRFLLSNMDTQLNGSTWRVYLNILSSYLLVLLLLCISTVVLRANAKARKLSRLGARAPAVPSRLPLGTR